MSGPATPKSIAKSACSAINLNELKKICTIGCKPDNINNRTWALAKCVQNPKFADLFGDNDNECLLSFDDSYWFVGKIPCNGEPVYFQINSNGEPFQMTKNIPAELNTTGHKKCIYNYETGRCGVRPLTTPGISKGKGKCSPTECDLSVPFSGLSLGAGPGLSKQFGLPPSGGAPGPSGTYSSLTGLPISPPPAAQVLESLLASGKAKDLAAAKKEVAKPASVSPFVPPATACGGNKKTITEAQLEKMTQDQVVKFILQSGKLSEVMSCLQSRGVVIPAGLMPPGGGAGPCGGGGGGLQFKLFDSGNYSGMMVKSPLCPFGKKQKTSKAVLKILITAAKKCKNYKCSKTFKKCMDTTLKKMFKQAKTKKSKAVIKEVIKHIKKKCSFGYTNEDELIKGIIDDIIKVIKNVSIISLSKKEGRTNVMIQLKASIKTILDNNRSLINDKSIDKILLKIPAKAAPLKPFLKPFLTSLITKTPSSFGKCKNVQQIFICASKKCKGTKNYRKCMKTTLRKMHSKKKKVCKKKKKCSFGKCKIGSVKRRSGGMYILKKVKGVKKWVKVSSKRKSPAQSATSYRVGTTKKGLDRKMWVVKKTRAGVKRWVKKIK
jgi:hypothetical protein